MERERVPGKVIHRQEFLGTSRKISTGEFTVIRRGGKTGTVSYFDAEKSCQVCPGGEWLYHYHKSVVLKDCWAGAGMVFWADSHDDGLNR